MSAERAVEDGGTFDGSRHRVSPLLSDEQLVVWQRFLRLHATLARRLETDLVAEQKLPLASYDVLVQLVQSPQRRLRMTELAQRVLISRSGLTRLVDRLEREGLVVREACASDARGLFAVLTDQGYERLRRAAPTHLRGVRDYAMGRLSLEQTRTLGLLLDVMLDAEAEEV